MRFSYASFLVATLFTTAPARADKNIPSNIGIPSLGWVYDSRVQAIRPMQGTLGAAILGQPLNFGFPVSSASIASQRGFALVVSADDHRVRVILLRDGVIRDVEGALASPDRIVLSPSGRSALLYSKETRRLQGIGGLPDTPSVTREISADNFGNITELATSDDGERNLITGSDGAVTSFWWIDEKASAIPVPLNTSKAAIAFQPEGREAIAATQEGDLYRIGAGASVTSYGAIALADSGDPIAAQLSREGTRAYVAYAKGTIAEIDSGTGVVRTTSCGCKATGLDPVSSTVFRVNEPSGLPLLLMNVSDDGPGIWFIPPDRSAPEASANGTEIAQ